VVIAEKTMVWSIVEGGPNTHMMAAAVDGTVLAFAIAHYPSMIPVGPISNLYIFSYFIISIKLFVRFKVCFRYFGEGG
jgi:hypothetical protein